MGQDSKTKQRLQSLFRTFMSLEVERHYVEHVRPTKVFFGNCYSGSDGLVIWAYNTLVRVSLALTFAGIAAILFVAGKEIASISDGNADDVTVPILNIIETAGTKFWITAAGFGLGNLMLIFSQVLGAFITIYANSMFRHLDIILDGDDASDFVKSSQDGLSTKEKNKLQSSLADNIEAISAMGREINDELIAKIGNIVSHNQEVTELILDNITQSFAELREQGIVLNVRSSMSNEIESLMKILVQEITQNSHDVNKICEAISSIVITQRSGKSWMSKYVNKSDLKD